MLQSLLGTIQSGEEFKGLSHKGKMETLRNAISTRIEELKEPVIKIPQKATKAKRAPKKTMSISDIAKEQLDIAVRNGLGRHY